MRTGTWTTLVAGCILALLPFCTLFAGETASQTGVRIEGEIVQVSNLFGVTRARVLIMSTSFENDVCEDTRFMIIREIKRHGNIVPALVFPRERIGDQPTNWEVILTHRKGRRGIDGPLAITGRIVVRYDLPSERVFDWVLATETVDGPQGSFSQPLKPFAGR